MKSKSNYFSHSIFLLLLALGATFSLNSLASDKNAQESKNHQQQLIEQLAISQGKGSFTQKNILSF